MINIGQIKVSKYITRVKYKNCLISYIAGVYINDVWYNVIQIYDDGDEDNYSYFELKKNGLGYRFDTQEEATRELNKLVNEHINGLVVEWEDILID